ncbi:hypothetical protein PAPHI01_0855 [Pancytospora philotis]|nr:hypothetical protein PAPHI01_0855 [Pancytospora philotis]
MIKTKIGVMLHLLSGLLFFVLESAGSAVAGGGAPQAAEMAEKDAAADILALDRICLLLGLESSRRGVGIESVRYKNDRFIENEHAVSTADAAAPAAPSGRVTAPAQKCHAQGAAPIEVNLHHCNGATVFTQAGCAGQILSTVPVAQQIFRLRPFYEAKQFSPPCELVSVRPRGLKYDRTDNRLTRVNAILRFYRDCLWYCVGGWQYIMERYKWLDLGIQEPAPRLRTEIDAVFGEWDETRKEAQKDWKNTIYSTVYDSPSEPLAVDFNTRMCALVARLTSLLDSFRQSLADFEREAAVLGCSCKGDYLCIKMFLYRPYMVERYGEDGSVHFSREIVERIHSLYGGSQGLQRVVPEGACRALQRLHAADGQGVRLNVVHYGAASNSSIFYLVALALRDAFVRKGERTAGILLAMECIVNRGAEAQKFLDWVFEAHQDERLEHRPDSAKPGGTWTPEIGMEAMSIYYDDKLRLTEQKTAVTKGQAPPSANPTCHNTNTAHSDGQAEPSQAASGSSSAAPRPRTEQIPERTYSAEFQKLFNPVEHCPNKYCWYRGCDLEEPSNKTDSQRNNPHIITQDEICAIQLSQHLTHSIRHSMPETNLYVKLLFSIAVFRMSKLFKLLAVLDKFQALKGIGEREVASFFYRVFFTPIAEPSCGYDAAIFNFLALFLDIGLLELQVDSKGQRLCAPSNAQSCTFNRILDSFTRSQISDNNTPPFSSEEIQRIHYLASVFTSSFYLVQEYSSKEHNCALYHYHRRIIDAFCKYSPDEKVMQSVGSSGIAGGEPSALVMLARDRFGWKLFDFSE